MTAPKDRWSLRIAAAADADFVDILRWTAERFGPRQARVYATTLWATIDALTKGPTIAGVRTRDDIADGLLTVHVARGGRKGRHFVVFRATSGAGANCVEVLRILHDAMDLPGQFEGRQEDG